MKYKITINDKVKEVTLLDKKGTTISFECEGNNYTVDVSPIVKEKTYTKSEVSSQPAQTKPSTILKAASSNSVVAPMPGTVVSISVKGGDKVKRGSILMVIEAMKMENNITSPKDGTVKEIMVKSGIEVDNGQTLLTFE